MKTKKANPHQVDAVVSEINYFSLVNFIFDYENEIIDEERLIFADNAEKVIATLDEREQCAMHRRFSGMTLKETGAKIIKVMGYKRPCEGISKERARQIISKARRKMRHPSRLKIWQGMANE